MRLNKYLAACEVASRRGAEAYILEGRVTLNGQRVKELGIIVNENKDIVKVDGKQVQPRLKKVYILLNKPKGVITTVKDEFDRKSVMDIVKVRERVYPVGRLDRNSEGLLLLTNDGLMANRLTHPQFKVVKTYRAKLDKPFEQEDFAELTSGIELEDGKTAPCRARFYSDTPDRIELQMREGRNRQVRRMFEALGYEVKALKRTSFGPLNLRNLNRSEWRLLSMTEVMQLRQAVDLMRPEKKQSPGKENTGQKKKNNYRH
jgi:23S rRNA pseudouridine2605 synthase